MTQDHTLHVAGTPVALLPERAVWWPAAGMAMVADLHWGKSEALQRAGIPLPSTPLADDLSRLSQVLDRLPVKRLMILGDLIHAQIGLTDAVSREIAAWRARHADVAMQLVRGNHDRRLRLPTDWRMHEVPPGHSEGPFKFLHEPRPELDHDDPLFAWCGHIHPVVTVRGGHDQVRVPCFHISATQGVLPAFGSLTGGFEVTLLTGDQVFAVAEQVVLVRGRTVRSSGKPDVLPPQARR